MGLKDHNNNFITGNNIGNNAYEYDWFSGSQIGIMIGDVLIDSAVNIQFSVQQTKTPVYGYSNQYYSFLADGHVIVQGTITIAFKEAGYLMWPMQRFQDTVSASRHMRDTQDWNKAHTEFWTSPRYSVDANGNKINYYDTSKAGNSLTAAAKAASNKRVMEANVEQMFDWQHTADSSRQNKNFNRYWKELGALPDNEFENWAETFEDAIWYGSDSNNPLVRDKLFSKNLPKDDPITNEQVLSHRRLDQYPNIDIWIVYGDMSRQPANHTVRKIMDLSFTGQAQTIEVSGEPIMETYSWIARNIA